MGGGLARLRAWSEDTFRLRECSTSAHPAPVRLSLARVDPNHRRPAVRERHPRFPSDGSEGQDPARDDLQRGRDQRADSTLSRHRCEGAACTSPRDAVPYGRQGDSPGGPLSGPVPRAALLARVRRAPVGRSDGSGAPGAICSGAASRYERPSAMSPGPCTTAAQRRTR